MSAPNWPTWQAACFNWLFPLFFLSGSLLQAQLFPVLKGQYRYGSEGDDQAKALAVDQEGRIFLLATTGGKGKQVTENAGCTDIWVACLNTQKTLAWEKSFGGMYCDEASSLAYHGDKVWVTGMTASFLNHPEQADRYRSGDGLVLSMNTDGSLNELQVAGQEEKDIGTIILPLGEEKAIAAGYTFSSLGLPPGPAGSSDIWVRTFSPDTTQPPNGFMAGGNGSDWPVALHAISGGEILLTANTTRLAPPQSSEAYPKPWVIVLDTALKRKKSFILPASSPVQVMSSAWNPATSTLALAGFAIRQDSDPQFWMMLCDATGKVLFEKIWGGSGAEYLSGIIPCKDGGWIMTGWSGYYTLESPMIKGGEDLWVIRLNPQQEIEWEKSWGGPGDERGIAIAEYIPGVYLVLGQRNQTPESDLRDLWLLQIEEEVCDLPELQPACKYYGPEPRIGQYLQFTLPTPPSEKITCVWDFGDGTTSKELNPMKKYYRVGDYQVKVTYKGGQACEKKVKLPEKLLIR